jgi:ankyrin repeat protein
MADVNDAYALFDAIMARKPLAVIRWIVAEHPHLVQESLPIRSYDGVEWRSGALALHLSIQYRMPDDVVRYICRRYPRALRVKDSLGRVPLHYIAGRDMSLDTIRYFVREWPVALQSKDRMGDLVLHAAVTNDNLPMEAIRFLVEQNPAAVRERGYGGMLPLMAALERGVPSIGKVRYLAEQWPPALRQRDDDGNLPIHASAKSSSLPVGHIRCLVGLGQDSVRERNGAGVLPLHLVAGRRRHEHSLPILRYLLEMFPASIFMVEGEDGYLAVHAAIWSKAPLEVIRLLVHRYPECLERRTAWGSLALHMAADSEISLEAFTFVVEQYPQAVREVERGGSGFVALHIAAGNRHPSPSALRLLLAVWPESILFRNLVGRTALHVAVDQDRITEDSPVLEAMRLLVEHGPEAVRMRDTSGHLPLHTLLTRLIVAQPAVQLLVGA